MTHNSRELDRRFFVYFAIPSILYRIKGLDTILLDYLFINNKLKN